jgi:hypothetical protein
LLAPAVGRYLYLQMSGRAQLFALGLWMVAAVVAAPAAWAAELRVPLTIPYPTLSEALKAQLYNGAGHRADLWRESDCQYLYAENPRFSGAGNLLRLESDANLNLGTLVGPNCIDAISWQGIVQVLAAPYVTRDWKLKFRVQDLNLYNPEHQKTAIAGHGFDLVKGYFVPPLEQFSFDLKTPVVQLAQLIEAGAPDEYHGQVTQALATLSTVPPAIASANGLRVTLRMYLPPGLHVPSVAPRQTLTQADLDAWENALDAWDAFVVFAVKQLGASIADQPTREELLDLLLDSRHRLVKVLAQPQPGGGPDPVRLLFIDTWSRFGRIVQRAAERGLLGNRTLEFLSFISAGDALIAFDQAAPALGMRITAQDLRGLAHIMAPRLNADPLTFSFDEDPELQKLFHIRPPLALPDALPNGPDDAPDLAPSPPEPDGHSAAGSPARDFLARLMSWISPPALAATMAVVTIDHEILEVALHLRRKLPERADLPDYAADVGQLLDLSASRAIDDDYLEAEYGSTTRRLVRSAAWQESCWRQFVRRGKRITYLESSSHDLGLMQVNKYVWRGFYSIPRLEWDIAYNAGAGAQILLRRLRDCARDAAGKGVAASSDDLVRSAYSAYNGGPASCNRWNNLGESSEKAVIDISFWLKYQALEQGSSFDILQCAAQWDHAPGH